MTTNEQPPIYRVADRDGEGWVRNGPDDTFTTFPRRDLPPMPYAQLEAERGPLRPVVAMESEDSQALAQALAAAGKKGFATLLFSLNAAARALIADGRNAAVFTSGRPGSWEADLFRSQILWEGADIAPGRRDPAAEKVADALIHKWITGPVQVELADSLASILGKAALIAGSWTAITDQWLAKKDVLEHWTAAYRFTNQSSGAPS
ncbi:hypothetical protein [Streptomyces sp. cg35]|uniref:hypothetical protein n=1 Tax=Streptomyces sp. cg35 TaxID=3421650 RepID=UPI003D16FF2E